MAFISILHVVLAFIVIVLVLVQDSKGGGLGAFSAGGGSNSLLGPTGAPSLLAQLTRWVVVGFAITSVVLTNLAANKGTSALDAAAPAAAPTQGSVPANPVSTPVAAPSSPAETAPAAPAEQGK